MINDGDQRVIAAGRSRTVEVRSIVILMTAAVCLTAARFTSELLNDDTGEFERMLFWSGTQILFYAVVPMLVWTIVLRRPLTEIGMRVDGSASHAWVYGALFAVAVPFVLLASTTAEFQARYPLPSFPPGSDPWPRLWLWWGVYALQFVAVELFFRGFLVLGLAPRFGALAIPVMVIPYTMIHFVKPPAEAFAAIIGGVVMGVLAFRTRSIWWGVALHCAVAALMDVSSLWHKALLW